MAIDNSGISSLDAGASDITYSGNEGPKSPQEEQQMQMASLMQEYKDYVMQQEEAGRPAMPFEEWVRSIQSPMAEGGIARLGYANGQRVGFRVGKGAGMEKTSDTGMAEFDFGPKDTGPKPDTSDDRFKQYAENIVDIPPPKPDPKDPDPPKTWRDKREKDIEKAKLIAKFKKIKPKGTWAQRSLYNLLPKSDMGYQFLETLEEENPEMFDMLPEELKN